MPFACHSWGSNACAGGAGSDCVVRARWSAGLRMSRGAGAWLLDLGKVCCRCARSRGDAIPLSERRAPTPCQPGSTGTEQCFELCLAPPNGMRRPANTYATLSNPADATSCRSGVASSHRNNATKPPKLATTVRLVANEKPSMFDVGFRTSKLGQTEIGALKATASALEAGYHSLESKNAALNHAVAHQAAQIATLGANAASQPFRHAWLELG